MGIINRLDPHVANCIAAGEVVERPSSVVKELAENALDAGADIITVELEDGGVSSIVISDNGCGMSADDARTAFLRHATSKIAAEEDLDGILTLGFRGEALAAISAVSVVELVTRLRGEPFGTRLLLEGGTVTEEEETGCPEGTTITVKKLFFNTPARMKFLKKTATEGMYCTAVIGKLALSHPEVSFRLVRDGKTVLRTSGDNSLASAVYSVCGREFAAEQTDAEYREGPITVWGKISKPENGRASRQMQYFFLNGRGIQSKTLTAALENAYKGHMTTGKFPGCVLHLACDPEKVDVNVHPSKLEVRFADEHAAYEAVYYAVKNALEGGVRPVMEPSAREKQPAQDARTERDESAQRPAVGIEPEPAPPEIREAAKNFIRTVPAAAQTDASAQQKTDIPSVNRVQPVRIPAPDRGNGITFAGWQERQTPAAELHVRSDINGGMGALAQDFGRTLPQRQDAGQSVSRAPETQSPEEKLPGEDTVPDFRVLGEVFRTYIVAECGDEVMFIDKHAAHERIRYEELKRALESGEKPGSQLLLAPLIVPVSPAEMAVLCEHAEELQALGLDAEPFGTADMAVRALPADADPNQAASLLSELAGAVRLPELHARREAVLERTACHSAVRAGGVLSMPEMEALVRQILADPTLRHCPHGRPVAVTMKKTDFERNFKR